MRTAARDFRAMPFNSYPSIAFLLVVALADVKRHYAGCEGKAALFDFLNRNAITDEKMAAGKAISISTWCISGRRSGCGRCAECWIRTKATRTWGQKWSVRAVLLSRPQHG
ncbi:MAG: hypothetical protein KGM97_05560 [Alphaproteobacteria bacterium]|nr:hypothetical protein [Alphaproteobacteria bacterium]MDE2630440.1 hypothetical protein [Alphaproteobacteria bacterium]